MDPSLRRLRKSIVGLMALILVTAGLLTALIQPTRLLANAVFSLALLLNTAAVVAAISTQVGNRSTWAGAAIAGWAYLALSLGPGLDGKVGPYLITTPMIDILYEQIDSKDKPKTYRMIFINASGTPTPAYGPFPPAKSAWVVWNANQPPFDLPQIQDTFTPNTSYSFYRIAHSLFDIVAGLAGGLFARLLSRRPVGPSHASGVPDSTNSIPSGHP